MLENLKKQVYDANMALVKNNLVRFTFGNVSGIDREKGLIVIKPSGINYKNLSPLDLPVIDLEGNIVEGYCSPSSDTATHIELYKAFPKIGGIAHAHSVYASTFAQAGRGIRPYGITHAEYFASTIPCTRKMSPNEIAENCEKNIGIAITEMFKDVNYESVRAALVNSHAPFAWGKSPKEAAELLEALEYIAEIAYRTEMLQSTLGVKSIPMQQDLLNRHFSEKNPNV